MARYSLSIRGFSLLTSALLLAAILAGCGSDNPSGETTSGIAVKTGSLSKAEFVKETNAICEKTKSGFEKRLAASLDEAPKAKDEALAFLVKTNLVPTYEGMIDRVKLLGGPAGEEEEVAEFLNALQQDLERASAQPVQAFKTGTPFGEASAAAAGYGLNSCVATFG